LGSTKYLVVTASTGMNPASIASRVFRDRELVYARKHEFGNLASLADTDKLHEAVRKHHLAALDDVMAGKLMVHRGSDDYLEEARMFLRKRANAKALAVLRDAVDLYPEDPHVMTYYGTLTAVVDKKYTEGIEACRRALELMRQKAPNANESMPLFFLNLARAYLAADDRKGAVDTIYSGMRYDVSEGVLHKELVKLGVRRRPALPFLTRSNPINKYIGMMLYSSDKGKK